MTDPIPLKTDKKRVARQRDHQAAIWWPLPAAKGRRGQNMVCDYPLSRAGQIRPQSFVV